MKKRSKKQMREQMRVYLAVPENRAKHNAWSNRWYHARAKFSVTHKANVAKAVRKWQDNNKLTVYFYQAFNLIIKKENQSESN